VESRVSSTEESGSRSVVTPLLRALIIAGITGGLISAAVSSLFNYAGQLSLDLSVAAAGALICLAEVTLQRNTFRMLPRAFLGFLAGFAGGFVGITVAQSVASAPLVVFTIGWGIIGSFIGIGYGVEISYKKPGWVWWEV
jgi:putative flippase GtrA